MFVPWSVGMDEPMGIYVGCGMVWYMYICHLLGVGNELPAIVADTAVEIEIGPVVRTVGREEGRTQVSSNQYFLNEFFSPVDDYIESRPGMYLGQPHTKQQKTRGEGNIWKFEILTTEPSRRCCSTIQE